MPRRQRKSKESNRVKSSPTGGAHGSAGRIEPLEKRLMLTADLISASVFKTAVFDQTATSTLIADPTSPYTAGAAVYETSDSPNSVTSASLTLPDGTVEPLTQVSGTDIFLTLSDHTSLADLDSSAPAGSYPLQVVTVHDGTHTFPLTSSGSDAFPAALELTDFDALQGANASQGINVTWGAASGGTTTNFERLQVFDAVTGNLVFDSGAPDSSGALNGTDIGSTLPSGTLVPGRAYTGRVTFAAGQMTTDVNFGGTDVAGHSALLSQTDFDFYTEGSTVNSGALVVTGTPAADTITVSTDGTNFIVDENSIPEQTFPIIDVTSITVNAGPKTDTVTINLPTSGSGSMGVLVNGGGGADTIVGGGGPDTLNGGGGSDSITAGHGNSSISGGNGNDILLGVTGDDGISDTISGGAGDDFINGGSCTNSYLAGGLNADTIIGGIGSNNTLKGGRGADVLTTGNEDSLTLTGDSPASLVVTADSLIGGRGHDTVIGSIGADSLTGGNGADVFEANSGNDVLEDFTPAQGDLQPAQDVYLSSTTPTIDFNVSLKIIVNGTTVAIPADAGSFAGVVSVAQVTSVAGDGTATVNFSTPGMRTFVLADFFDQWGITFNGRGMAQFAGLGAGASVAMTVNGSANTAFSAYQVQSGDSIVITVTDPGT